MRRMRSNERLESALVLTTVLTFMGFVVVAAVSAYWS